MASQTYRELAIDLKSVDCEFVRQGKGDHEIWKNAAGEHFSVPTKLKGEGTLKAIRKKAGL